MVKFLLSHNIEHALLCVCGKATSRNTEFFPSESASDLTWAIMALYCKALYEYRACRSLYMKLSMADLHNRISVNYFFRGWPHRLLPRQVKRIAIL